MIKEKKKFLMSDFSQEIILAFLLLDIINECIIKMMIIKITKYNKLIIRVR